MNNDLISREALKEAFEKVYPLSVNEMGGIVNKRIYDIIDNAPAVLSEITEKQAILLLINNGWLVNHDKELREKWERPQTKCENCDLYFRAMTKEEMRKGGAEQ